MLHNNDVVIISNRPVCTVCRVQLVAQSRKSQIPVTPASLVRQHSLPSACFRSSAIF